MTRQYTVFIVIGVTATGTTTSGSYSFCCAKHFVNTPGVYYVCIMLVLKKQDEPRDK